MSKELYDAYHKLNDSAKNELRMKLKDSPLASSFMHFLDRIKNRNFKNREAVEFIYKDEQQSAPYAVLENRYFKLRKKFTEEMQGSGHEQPGQFTEEETHLAVCRQLLVDNRKDEAYNQLSKLANDCREKNIFEMLPQIIDNMIFCNQTLNRLDRNESLYPLQEKAIGLQADCYRMQALARKVYEINFKRGVKHAKKELEEIKDLSLKHKAYPRFAMCYHHVSLYYKLGSRDYLQDMQVISRHFRQFKELNSKHPDMPLVSYRKNYQAYQHMHYGQIQIFYHYNRMEFEEAYQAMKEMWELVNSGDPTYALLKTESIFYNMFSAQEMTERYAAAEKTVEAYHQFLKDNKHTSKLLYVHVLQAMLRVAAFKKGRPEDLGFLLQKTEEYLQQNKDGNNVQTSLAEVELLRAKLLYMSGKYESAQKALRSAHVKQYLEAFKMTTFFETILKGVLNNSEQKETARQIRKRLLGCKDPSELVQLRWLKRALDQVL